MPPALLAAASARTPQVARRSHRRWPNRSATYRSSADSSRNVRARTPLRCPYNRRACRSARRHAQTSRGRPSSQRVVQQQLSFAKGTRTPPQMNERTDYSRPARCGADEFFLSTRLLRPGPIAPRLACPLLKFRFHFGHSALPLPPSSFSYAECSKSVLVPVVGPDAGSRDSAAPSGQPSFPRRPFRLLRRRWEPRARRGSCNLLSKVAAAD